MVDKKSISLILVTYNRLELLKNVLSAIKQYNWKYEQFVIIDNNSSDGTVDYLKSISKDWDIKVVYQTDNIGHGAGLASGFEYLQNYSKSKYYILLEDDSIPKSYLIDKLYQTIEKSNYDLISSYGMKFNLGKRIGIVPKENEVLNVDFCLLDGAIINSDVISSVGTPEKDWFMMFDDFEYCYRIKKAKFSIGVIKNDFHEILHLGGGQRFSDSNLWRGYYQTRNHIFFVKKHFNIFILVDFIIMLIKRIYGSMLAPDRFTRIKFRLLGIYHGLISKKGKTLRPDTLKFQ